MFSPLKLAEIIHPHISKETKRFWIAYSGGLDSHVLLHALKSVCLEFPDILLEAIHVNHHLSPNASAWELHCQTVCRSLGIPLKTVSIDISLHSGSSKEAIAREQRYHIFNTILNSEEILLTAHHQDDQAETLLLQLLRGAGVHGLAAMPEMKSFGKGYHLRPLLNFTRAELKIYAEQNSLQWIEDESNFDVTFDRNYIRHTLIPLIKKRWPAVTKILSRTANNCAHTLNLLEKMAQQDLQAAQGQHPKTISIKKLLNLDEERRHNLIYYWLRALQLPIPDKVKFQKILSEVVQSAEDANPLLHWQGAEIRRYQDDLYAMKPLTKLPKDLVFAWELTETQNIFLLPNHLGLLIAHKVMGKGIKIDKQDQMQIRFRKSGEKCQPAGRKEHHQVKKLFQEWHIPTWQREQIPFIYINNQLAAIVGYCICEPFAAKPDEDGWVFEMEKVK